MLIFVYGDDTFRVREKVAEMETRFKEKFDPAGMNAARYETNAEIGTVMQQVQSPPFLGEKRLTVIRDLVASTKKADAEHWVEGFKKTPGTSIVIFWETAEPAKVEKAELWKALKGESDVHTYPFPELEGPALTRWVMDRAAAMKMQIDRAAIDELVMRVGGDLWRMNNELEKLSAFANGTAIHRELVTQMVAASFEEEIFEFVDAVSRKDVKTALARLNQERQAGASDHQLLSMLTRQVRILLGARALLDQNPRADKQELAETMAIHPFVAQKALQQARSYRQEALKAAHELLYQYDLGIKTGQLSAEMAVDLTVQRLLV